MTCAFPLDMNWASQARCSFSFHMVVSGFLIKKTFIHVCELEANEWVSFLCLCESGAVNLMILTFVLYIWRTLKCMNKNCRMQFKKMMAQSLQMVTLRTFLMRGCNFCCSINFLTSWTSYLVPIYTVDTKSVLDLRFSQSWLLGAMVLSIVTPCSLERAQRLGSPQPSDCCQLLLVGFVLNLLLNHEDGGRVPLK